MEIFRITTAKWANSLTASGFAGRWNSNGIKMIYAAGSRSLACLENIVHRGQLELAVEFRVMVIYVPDELHQVNFDVQLLPENWHNSGEAAYSMCRPFGDEWIRSKLSPVLRVPSAIMKNEYNFLVNPEHPDFRGNIKIIDTEPFFFDPRIKS